MTFRLLLYPHFQVENWLTGFQKCRYKVYDTVGDPKLVFFRSVVTTVTQIVLVKFVIKVTMMAKLTIRSKVKKLSITTNAWRNHESICKLHSACKVGNQKNSFIFIFNQLPIPVVAWSRAWVSSRLLAGIAGLNPTGGHGSLSVVSVVRFQVEVSATRWSLVQRSSIKCDREASIMWRPWPTRGCCAMGGGDNCNQLSRRRNG